jgi:hypothetical protein
MNFIWYAKNHKIGKAIIQKSLGGRKPKIPKQDKQNQPRSMPEGGEP